MLSYLLWIETEYILLYQIDYLQFFLQRQQRASSDTWPWRDHTVYLAGPTRKARINVDVWQQEGIQQ